MSPRPLVGPRLQRVLASVPWVLAHPGVTLDELAQRFSVGRAELEQELELLLFCGLPPYTADRLMDVSVIDGTVSMRLAEYFDRPLRLRPAEGLALLAAGRALLAVPGSDPEGPLATALGKLEAALGVQGRVSVDVGPAGQLEELQAALTDREQVEITYFSFARDEMTVRIVDPWRVFHAFGAWYLAAWCHRANDERIFRVDRVRAVRRLHTPVTHAPEPDGASDSVYTPRADDVRVTLRLEQDASWVAESYPYEQLEQLDEGRSRLTLAVSEVAWLERLLLILGPGATVEAPPALRDVARDAATRILNRYRDAS